MGTTAFGLGTSNVEAERVLGDSSTNLGTATIDGSTVLTGTKEDATKINSITNGVKVTGTGYSVNARIYAGLGFASDNGFSVKDGRTGSGNGFYDGKGFDVTDGNVTAKDFTVTGKMIVEKGYVDKTTTDGTFVKQADTIGTNINALDSAISDETKAREDADTALQKNIDKEASDRAAADNQLNTKMNNGFATIQEQQDEQDTKIAKNQKDITANAGKIQNNTDAIKANSDKLTDHEGRIAANETNIANNAESIKKETNARMDADQAEAKARADADTQLTNKMNSGFATIQGQQDEQDAQIAKNQKDITANAGKIQNNTDAIKANSDKLDKHEDRIASNEKNIETNAETIKKVQGDVVDNKNAISAEVADRQAADQNLQTQINNNNTSVNNEAAERKAADQNLQNQINNNSTSINDLYGRYSSLKTDINKVGARSAALAGLHPLDFDPANKFNFAVASGSFKGENSVALGAFYRPNENIMFSAASTMGDSDNAYTFGLSFKIGPSSAKTKTTSPDAEELYKVVGQLQDQLAAQQKEIEQLKANKAK